MKTILKSLVFPLPVVLLMAADPSLKTNQPAWKNKQMEQWSEQDAKLILTSSPWVKKATPALMPLLSESQRRQGGQMGGGDGVGMEAFSASTVTGVKPSTAGKRRPIHLPVLQIRWESASAVRTAEVKAHEEDAPDVASDSYAVAVYDVPGVDVNQKALPFQLKKDAFLRRGGKKDRRASRVDLLPQDGGLTTIIFMFPRSDEFTTQDQRITFVAQIGRLSVAQYFYTQEMTIQGKLEL
jgi:hypothetical protein